MTAPDQTAHTGRTESMAHDTWFILREPKCVPQLKGPFRADQVKPFLIELSRDRTTALVTVLTIQDGQPSVQDGPECMEMLDGRLRQRAAMYRSNTKIAWRAALGDGLATAEPARSPAPPFARKRE